MPNALSPTVVDALARQQKFTELEIIGAVCIGVGFLLIVIPDQKVSIRIKDRFFRKPAKGCVSVTKSHSPADENSSSTKADGQVGVKEVP
ncbi:hypothetical protein BV898_01175 [Hypsibius exemplaris]|uniref:Uncharacterized protein n=1 Tax=Hypsibius exemplaris TaxID=2072580 RepID=A0A1W0XBT2_HYPEX|nr:hypothetical protein BV898_01175 [Hypsibius exemplaris]